MDPLKLFVEGGAIPVRPEFEKRSISPAGESRKSESTESKKASAAEVEAAGTSTLKDQGHMMTYAVDRDTHEVVARIVDRESGEVVKELPSEELQKAKKAMEEFHKANFNRTV